MDFSTDARKVKQVGEEGAAFQIRFIASGNACLLTSLSGENFFLADSGERWYDLIQERFPTVRKCACKCEWFKVTLVRELMNAPDELTVYAECEECGTVISVGVLKTDVEAAMENPLVPCKKPKIRSRVTRLGGYLSVEDRIRILEHLKESFFAYALLAEGEKGASMRAVEEGEIASLERGETEGVRVQRFFFSHAPIELEPMRRFDGLIVPPEDLWKKEELIVVENPVEIWGIGKITAMYFCARFFEKGKPKNKSMAFRGKTADFITWLSENFVTARGKNCFDSKEVFAKLSPMVTRASAFAAQAEDDVDD